MNFIVTCNIGKWFSLIKKSSIHIFFEIGLTVYDIVPPIKSPLCIYACK